MGDPRCNWVRDRLPLLAGDELRGSERRRVERHLIGCAACRARRDSLAGALTALHAAAAELPARSDAPSLWPALARQIEESRHEAPSVPWVPARYWPRLAAAALLLVAFGAAATAVRQQHDNALAEIAIAAQPLPALEVLPAPALPERVAQAEPPSEEAPRYDYMLDRGTPMGPDGDDSRMRPSY